MRMNVQLLWDRTFTCESRLLAEFCLEAALTLGLSTTALLVLDASPLEARNLMRCSALLGELPREASAFLAWLALALMRATLR